MAEKKMTKQFKEGEDTVIQITILGGQKGMMEFDFNDLPEGIQAKLGPFGLSHKLGDAAAGKREAEAEEAIEKVWEGLMASNWSVRAPAAAKISAKDIMNNMNSLEPEEKERVAEALKILGVDIPGLT